MENILKLIKKDIPFNLNHLLWLFMLATFIACFYHIFGWLYYKYSIRDSYYSHGYFIPFISGYLIYMKREKLKEIEPSSDVFGLVILVFTLFIHVLAVMSDINFISGFSIFFYILGSSLYIFGRELTKKVAFPLCFLIFMFPIPNNFIDILGLPSKSLATTVGLRIIDFTNIPYLREGFKIHLADSSLLVGTPCNGMKSFISFVAFGLFLSHITNMKIWKRIVILTLIFPLAIFLNGCRIAILVYIANNYGIEKASPESYLHDMSGLTVITIGLITLLLFIGIGKLKNKIK